MRLHSITIPVSDIDSAICFYTQKLYFKKIRDIAKIDKKTGLKHREVSLRSTQSSSNIEIIFSTLANSFAPLLRYKIVLFNSGVPYLNLSVKNIENEYSRLIKLDVNFSLSPQLIGLSKIAVFEDNCGNHIQINEEI